MENLLTPEIWEQFYIKDTKVGVISIKTDHHEKSNIFTSKLKLGMMMGQQLTTYSNSIKYTINGGSIEWIENIFIQEGSKKTVRIENNKLISDNRIIMSKIPKNIIPDFAYFLVLSRFDFDESPAYNFTYINAKTADIIPNSKLTLIKREDILIEGIKYEALQIQEQKNNIKSNIFWIADDGKILKSDWQGALSLWTANKETALRDLPNNVIEFMN